MPSAIPVQPVHRTRHPARLPPAGRLASAGRAADDPTFARRAARSANGRKITAGPIE
jgi:hypothetical protein